MKDLKISCTVIFFSDSNQKIKYDNSNNWVHIRDLDQAHCPCLFKSVTQDRFCFFSWSSRGFKRTSLSSWRGPIKRFNKVLSHLISHLMPYSSSKSQHWQKQASISFKTSKRLLLNSPFPVVQSMLKGILGFFCHFYWRENLTYRPEFNISCCLSCHNAQNFISFLWRSCCFSLFISKVLTCAWVKSVWREGSQPVYVGVRNIY